MPNVSLEVKREGTLFGTDDEFSLFACFRLAQIDGKYFWRGRSGLSCDGQ